MKWIILFLVMSLRGYSQECEETFKKTVNIGYFYTPEAHNGIGMEWGLTGDISRLSLFIGYGAQWSDQPVYKQANGDSLAVNFRLYTKFAWRLVRWDYKLSVNASSILGFDSEGAILYPGLKLFMPAGINTALSLEPYYVPKKDSYLIQFSLHYKFR